MKGRTRSTIRRLGCSDRKNPAAPSLKHVQAMAMLNRAYKDGMLLLCTSLSGIALCSSR